MIIVIDALNKEKFSGILDDMFQLRARVFGGRLGWDVEVSDGKEIDKFDALDPAYVVGLDDEGHVISCVRALQTTGPHMLADVFSSIMDGEPPLRSATLWESTRFCVDTQRLGSGKARNSVSYATCELMIGSLEFARDSGIRDIVTVIDPIMDRVLKRSDNAPYDYVGSKKQMGKVPALAALLDCSDERIGRVRNFADIHEDVFATEEEALALQEKARAARAAEQRGNALGRDGLSSEVGSGEILGYFKELVEASETVEERQKALAIMRHLSERGVIPGLTEMAGKQVH